MAVDAKLSMRLDKWLWAARFYKTRALAAEALDRGRIELNDRVAKPATAVQPGNRLLLRQGPERRVVEVLALSAQRGPAPVAQTLYAETPESLAARKQAAEARRLAPEPAASLEQGRPTKRDRRQMTDHLAAWQRWSASVDDLGKVPKDGRRPDPHPAPHNDPEHDSDPDPDAANLDSDRGR